MARALPRRRPPVRLCASSPSSKHNLLGLSEPELTALVVDNYNQPKFRAKQLHEWMYEKGVTDFDYMYEVDFHDPAYPRDEVAAWRPTDRRRRGLEAVVG